MPKGRAERLEAAVARLGPDELTAYGYWQASESPLLAPSTAARLFEPYLQGRTCAEIAALQQGVKLGDVVAAKVEYDWDARRDEYLDGLFNGVAQRVQQTQIETALMLCDVLAAFNRGQRECVARYLQTGDRAELGDIKVESLQGLKGVVDLLQRVTGTEPPRRVQVGGRMEHSHREVQDGGEPEPALGVVPRGRPVTAVEAAGAIAGLLAAKKSQV